MFFSIFVKNKLTRNKTQPNKIVHASVANIVLRNKKNCQRNFII